MAERITRKRYYTLFDYDIEEKWLSEMHADGWKLVDVELLKYTFERCTPEKVVYRFDFPEAQTGGRDSYIAMFKEYGWELAFEMNNYCCFRRSAEGMEEKELELFSDRQSRIEMMQRIIRLRLLPLLLIFCGAFMANIPNMMLGRYSSNIFSLVLLIVWGIITLLYLFIFTRCYIGYRRNIRRINDEAGA